jgi:SAM-dependent methyltransferase
MLFFEGIRNALSIVPEGHTLVDVGCGYGGLSIAWARLGGRAVAIDAHPENLRIIKKRLQSGEVPDASSVVPATGSALDLPVASGTCDYVLMSGVLEWVGFSRLEDSVRNAQLAALSEALRVLKPGGTLLVGTKNRLFPRYAWRDAQVGLPLTNLLPRRAADYVCRWTRGYSYRGYVYSYWGWTELLKAAGYESVRVRVPLFTYQYPLAVVPAWCRISVRQATRSLGALPAVVATAAAATRSSRAGFLRMLYYRALGAAGCLGLGAGSFLLVAEKPR